jgi:tetratricopeptide (TPR) repeat protein
LKNKDAIAQYNRAVELIAQQRYGEALVALAAVIRMEPHSADAIYAVGTIFYGQGRYAEAVGAYEAALAERPGFAEAHNNLGVAARANGDTERAVVAYERATQLRPGYADAFANLGTVLTELGEFSRAERAFDRAFQLDPTNVKVLKARFETRAAAPDDPRLRDVESVAMRIESLAPVDRVEAEFLLAKVYSDLEQRDEAFAHLVRANTAHRALIEYDEPAMLGLFARVKALFGPGFLRENAGGGARSEGPIFIIGMPRSGTTLIEQIFASHPRVRAGGELKAIYETVTEFAQTRDAHFPEMLAGCTPQDLRRLGERYLERVGWLAEAERFTDKMPTNFLYAGLIALALPNAKIVHVMRDPVDTCLSCYERHFNEALPYAYDLVELGRYYRAYADLSAHWREVLTPETLLEVRYEDVVADVEAQARRLLDHTGLEWDASVLEFHRTRRTVRTASVQQVRTPLYASAVGRARGYADKLQPLLEALAE